ncbi:MAG TPA: RagB/SusD family nutrient uptake outer membrane protein [Marinilabiliales bacterium]|nr:RagB/SusD family nutrient uptake outer membrane protein [Marinilabiliales bacterium]
MRNIVNKIKYVFLILAGSFLFGGCEEYLDQAPEAAIDPNDAYISFINFQGFTEDLYNCIVDVARCTPPTDYNFGDDTRMNVSFLLGYQFDQGNYWAWMNGSSSYFRLMPSTPAWPLLNPSEPNGRSTWWNSWYGIRKANLGLANIDKLVNATQEEKDLIKGQLYFFRAYFHFTLMRDWGGLPYIDKLLAAGDEMRYPRLNYQETALKADEDFAKAAELLPVNWDDTQAGQRTLGNNRQRISKIMALAFQGKNLLYAASPLMNQESTGDANYNVELSKKAAIVFANVIDLSNSTGMFQLQPWETYSDIFYTDKSEKIVPGGTEVIMNAPAYNRLRGGNTTGLPNCGFLPQVSNPTANYLKYWGMSNGLPIDDPNSGYDPNNPWDNRDPRFYKMIVVDGDQVCNSNAAGYDQYFQSYTGGRHRNQANNVTGYMSKKLWGLTQNKFDNVLTGGRYFYLIPIIRLSDVYLMYAEAVVNGYGTPQSSVPGNITAVQAVNTIRNRATVPDLDSKYTATKEAFMEQLIIERAVELSFENLRWNDLRRWLRNGDPRYLDKTELLFDRDPVTQKAINFQERLIVRRTVTERNNWLPFPLDYVSIYPEFKQNPGW